jgi:hypothetical protein
MKVNGIVIGFAVMGLALGAAALPAKAQSVEEETVCEFNFLELQPADLAKVPADRRTSYFAPVNEGDFAIRKCTESKTSQTQLLSCRTVISGWTPVVEFQTKSFKRPCQLVSCDGIGFIDAELQQLKVRALGQDTVEVFLDCQRRTKK